MQALTAFFALFSISFFGTRSDGRPSVRDDAPTDPGTDDVDTGTPEVGNEALIRLTDASYADGIGSLDPDAPNARDISNAMAQQTGDTPNAHGVSNLFWAWGQFIDHDLSLTSSTSGEFSPIPVTQFDDPEFTLGSIIPFTRITPMDGTGEDAPRQYENEITSLMDASMVYGSDADTLASLRDGAHLLLDDQGLVLQTGHGVLVGDVRGAENVALTSMHTLFVREHNRWVDELAAENPDLDDDTLFEMARIRVEAEIQAITYNEWLPMLVGPDAIADYEGYDPEETSAISVEFSTVAFRFGHSLLPTQLERTNEDGSDIDAGGLSLRDAFFNASAIAEGGGIDPLLRGLAGSEAQDLDTQVVEDVRSFLLGEDGTTGLDLAALNIERGRDLGVPKYNDLREQLGLERAEDFSDISADPDIIARLESVYDSVDDVDAWVGGLAEAPVDGGMIGETFATVIVDQFERVRDSDPFWSEGAADLTVEEFNALWSTTLSDVIENNTDIGALQDNVFLSHTRVGGTEGDDDITGDSGRDLLIGSAGDDTLAGGGGDDHIVGGTGNDSLSGGEGMDRFAFSKGDGVDVITDLNTAEDRISIDVEDTEIDISALFLPVDEGVDIDLGDGDMVRILAGEDLDEDDLASRIDLI